MHTLLQPATKLMQQLRLLPKFSLLALVFLTPLLVVTAFLFNELQKSIVIAQQEQVGVSYIRHINDIIHLAQQHRSLQHMLLNGNGKLTETTQQVRSDITREMTQFDILQKTDDNFDTRALWVQVNNTWQSLQSNLATDTSKASYDRHTDLLNQLTRLNTLIADRSNLSLDPQSESHHLVNLFTRTLPFINENLAEITGRGASIIDTGLFEGNEDVQLNSDIMLTKHTLANIPDQLQTLYREDPALKIILTSKAASIPATLTFLERARIEVLNSANQTSGNEFYEAGNQRMEDLSAFATTTANLINGLLQQRIDQATGWRDQMLAGVLLALTIAVYLFAGFYTSFSREVKRLENAVDSAASGDLTHDIHASGKDEISGLINAFGGMTLNLAKLVAEVRAGTETINLAAHEIASGNADLSARTESQAASLEQTASSMEELTATVQQNADHAQRASQLATSASTVAVKGGTAVYQVIDSMGSIRESSRKIADIISVIDSIAFQTNILALNAAVEAARAGEQGRGFAVVATEVRNLAQRSAGAAKEIKQLISNSVNQVEIGSKLVNDAGHTMQDVVTAIKQVADIVGEITLASQEQSAGIAQVNQTITHMDEMTQQNAAMVEQAAAAAESLENQATTLAEAVRVFKLIDNAKKSSGHHIRRQGPAIVSLSLRSSRPTTHKIADNNHKARKSRLAA